MPKSLAPRENGERLPRVTMVNYTALHSEAVKAINEQYLACRTLGHAWKYTKIDKTSLVKQWVQHLECVRCPVTKTQTLTMFGEIVSTRYCYPTDYRFEASGGPTKTDRSAMRLRILKSSSKHF